MAGAVPDAERWRALLSTRRLRASSSASSIHRSEFQRDADRIIFSSAFRRLADRTQVVPAPEDDNVHSRLTHSLEVSTIGRSIGARVGRRLADRKLLPAELTPDDVGDCVAAACLVHDLGNPPFGHAGEEAIREFFSAAERAPWMRALTKRQRADLLRFEGNAQSFRLVADRARPPGLGGMNLCAATLGALVKYPCDALSVDPDSGRASRKKNGINDAEDGKFERLARELSLRPLRPGRAWQRHPLVFLTEAADDIAFGIVDLEDALQLGLVGEADVVELLRPFAPHTAPRAGKPLAGAIADRLDDVARMRTEAIGLLVERVVATFMRNHEGLLSGDFDQPLTRAMPGAKSFRKLTDFAKTHYYRSSDVLKMEVAGAKAIQGLLRILTDACFDERSTSARSILKLHPFLDPGAPPYDRLMAITDHVSGMTDRTVMRQYRELSGVRLPGGRE